MTSEIPYRYCPSCGGGLELRNLKAGEPDRLVCTSCGYIFYLDPKVATGSIIEMDGGIVLLKRGIQPAYGNWVVPGGFVDRYETVPQAAERETWEESGLRVRATDLVGIYSYQQSYVVVVMYRAEYISGTLTASDESIDAAVFAKDKIPWDELAFPSTRDALTDYFRRGPLSGGKHR